MSKLKSFYYRIKMNGAFRYYNFHELPRFFEENGRFNQIDDFSMSDLESGMMFTPSEVYAFTDGENSNFYYGNIKISVSIKKKNEHVVRIYLKKPDDGWDMRCYGNGDMLNGNLMEIYTDYDVNVLDDKHCWNTIYENGPWDEYVYKTLNEFIDYVNDMTKENEFIKSYNGKNKHKNKVCCGKH